MKKKIMLFVALCLVISMTGCGNNQTTGDTPTTNQAENQTNTEAPSTEQPKQTNKGTVNGVYDVEIVAAKLATDFQGKPAIIVTYNFTNNSNTNASFLTSVGANAFQNSVQCAVATTMPDVMDAQPSLAQVQPGGTLKLECAYSLQDTTNPVTVQVGPLVNVTGEVNAQMVFTIGQ